MRPRYGILEITPAEKLVVDQLLQGKSNREIAVALHLSDRTVKYHLTNVYKKRGVEGRENLIVTEQKIRHGVLPSGRSA